MHTKGLGVDVNLREGFQLCSKAADLGSAYGYFHAGNAYFTGVGTTCDPKTAMTYFKKAATMGVKQAAEIVTRARRTRKIISSLHDAVPVIKKILDDTPGDFSAVARKFRSVDLTGGDPELADAVEQVAVGADEIASIRAKYTAENGKLRQGIDIIAFAGAVVGAGNAEDRRQGAQTGEMLGRGLGTLVAIDTSKQLDAAYSASFNAAVQQNGKMLRNLDATFIRMAERYALQAEAQ